jgi:hypothetical protein
LVEVVPTVVPLIHVLQPENTIGVPVTQLSLPPVPIFTAASVQPPGPPDGQATLAEAGLQPKGGPPMPLVSFDKTKRHNMHNSKAG